MDRRKFLIGAGSLAAGSAAGIGTGAFTSVSAERNLTVSVADDRSALLALNDEGTPNAREYVREHTSETLSIDITETDEGAKGVNDDALTVIRYLFEITNNGTQGAYVWASGLPDGIAMFTDDPAIDNDADSSDKFVGPDSPGDVKGSFSLTSNLNGDDIDGDEDPKGTAGYESAPYLDAGETLDNIGILVNGNFEDAPEDDDEITIHAVTQAELNAREGE